MAFILNFTIFLVYNTLWSFVLEEWHTKWQYWAILACVIAYGVVCTFLS